MAPVVYVGSGPVESDLASSFADRVSIASKQGNAIAGFDASPVLALDRLAGCECNNRTPYREIGVASDDEFEGRVRLRMVDDLTLNAGCRGEDTRRRATAL